MEKLIVGARKLGLQLSSEQLEQFHLYYQELIDWNQRMNLTAITDYEEVQIKHFLDSLTVTLAFKPPISKSDLYLIDVGTGAGIPVAPLPTLVELTLPLTTIGGSFIAQKKGAIEPEISQAAKAISLLGGKLREVKGIDLEEFTDERQLAIIDKVSPTPQQYPRRPGIPAKRPLV